MRIVITGGAGFIGSHYVRALLGGRLRGYESAEVIVLDKLTYAGGVDNIPLSNPRLTLVEGDICDPDVVNATVAGADVIVHFAAESHVDRSIVGASPFVQTNVAGTLTLLDAAHRSSVRRFLHVSTDEVYGSIDSGSWDEDCPLLPNSVYAASKAASDLMARAYFRTHGLNVTVTRCSNNFGPYQHPEKVIPNFITRLFQDQKVPVYGDGHNVREWLFVDDHCQALHAVLKSGRAGEIYNVHGGVEMSNLELTRHILEACGKGEDSIEFVEDRKGHDNRYSLDGTKISTELGYEPKTSFAEGLKATVRWYADNRGWWERRLTASERPVLQLPQRSS
ncbi:dTDP-glucose 4,6-dehydratase [Enemella evansiae]|uniref:dTDP-glucose 4,6-dehydratase n=1 Tax=Enemella evansiae TaxID=2016499 RepID=UPI000B968FFC|nr:dTDP-glucose 4,6-dehydratase [Enemella evansiae]OYO15471.1 dTDP-glucose 4,6-dehydratase [Enemella evansiae]